MSSHTDPGPLATRVFALSRALQWLGHHCDARCAPAIDELNACVWFIRRGGTLRDGRTERLVVVDLADSSASVARILQLIRDINACTAADGITLRERRGDDNGRALASLAVVATGSGSIRPFRYEFVAAAAVRQVADNTDGMFADLPEWGAGPPGGPRPGRGS